jgi:hypothetical protein
MRNSTADSLIGLFVVVTFLANAAFMGGLLYLGFKLVGKL